MKKYEDSLFYQIKLSAKCFDILFDHFFKNLDLGLSATEHLALSVIRENKGCCQRDLARIILKDRANTGKLADSLMKKGLINIEIKTKNNKPVKILSLTNKATALLDEVKVLLAPVIKQIQSEFSQKAADEAMEILKKFRKLVEKTVKVDI